MKTCVHERVRVIFKCLFCFWVHSEATVDPIANILRPTWVNRRRYERDRGAPARCVHFLPGPFRKSFGHFHRSHLLRVCDCVWRESVCVYVRPPKNFTADFKAMLLYIFTADIQICISKIIRKTNIQCICKSTLCFFLCLCVNFFFSVSFLQLAKMKGTFC